MAKNSIKVTDNPKLLKKVLSDGNYSLYLDFYLGRINVTDPITGEIKSKVQRKREFLKLTLYSKPKTMFEKQSNKDTLELAMRIRAEREKALKENRYGYKIKKVKNVNFINYFSVYYEKYDKKDKRLVKGAFCRFKDFLKEYYPKNQDMILPEQINKEFVERFVSYLQSRSKGEGASNYYTKFKMCMKNAYENGIIRKNPCTGVVCRIDKGILRKDVLSLAEQELLIKTTYKGQNQEIRKAFIFCLYTGMRFCDVKELKYSNIDYGHRLLSFEQLKTKGHSANSGVVIPLNDSLLSLVGTPPEDRNGVIQPNNYIFHLPSHTMCLKALRHWTEKAGITKHITWHCARHSFAVNILGNGANIKTVASLLGHSGLKHTEKYTRAVDELKEAAINSLPDFKL
ncbi:site-specific integrase [Coprobacter secundus]|uniref:Tyr recombinase domain-containing protein n=1 Tax=Coprobacter secundus subsp. similis TaxID=2751153 RepID=A0A7G1I0X7_9BACT|nr:site-specific integrase [Coprobacter secundus]BCI64893.1 hypothetical protein Cop2CBH44_32460 [Coprobacter secundus subsp. similis]